MIWAARIFVISGAILCILPGISHGQYLSVKRNFWGTYKYTNNGIDFQRFGSGWCNLLGETETVEEAYHNIIQARNSHYTGFVFGLGGSFMLGFLYEKNSNYEKFDDLYWYVAGGMVLTSIILEWTSAYLLDKGVTTYNRRQSGNPTGNRETGKFKLEFSGRSVSVSYYFW